MDVPNIDQIFVDAKNWLDAFVATNPIFTSFCTFLVGWVMKRSPIVERIVQFVAKYRR